MGVPNGEFLIVLFFYLKIVCLIRFRELDLVQIKWCLDVQYHFEIDSRSQRLC